MQNITIVLNKKMKMADLIDADYRLLLLLNKLNIPFGFGEKSVDTVCSENKLNTDCFLFLANYQSNKAISNIQSTFEALPLEPFILYLKSSHSYFLERRLPQIRCQLEAIFGPDDEKLAVMVLHFFDNYTQEVHEHMVYEDQVVFPYIHNLLNATEKSPYSIALFEERHNNIDAKMSELKQLLMKYIIGKTDQLLMVNILMDLYLSEEELDAHTFIEDNLVIPRVKEIERTTNY